MRTVLEVAVLGEGALADEVDGQGPDEERAQPQADRDRDDVQYMSYVPEPVLLLCRRP